MDGHFARALDEALRSAEKTGRSAKRIAEATGISETKVSNSRNSKRVTPPEEALRLANSLGEWKSRLLEAYAKDRLGSAYRDFIQSVRKQRRVTERGGAEGSTAKSRILVQVEHMSEPLRAALADAIDEADATGVSADRIIRAWRRQTHLIAEFREEEVGGPPEHSSGGQ